MTTSAHHTVRMPRLAAAAVGLGAATCLTLVPGAAFAASSHGQAGTAHGTQHATSAPKQSGSRGSVQLHDKSWQAQADPDGDTNGGVDQPGGQGGTVGSQDGNNGSGNDADCEDDNRGRGIPGHCKQKPGHPRAGTTTPGHGQPGREQPGTTTPGSTTPGTTPGASTPGSPSETTPSTTVTAVTSDATPTTTSTSVLAPEAQAALAAGSPSPATLAPAAATAAPGARTLPNTGADAALIWMLVGGAAAVGAGAVTVRRSVRASA